MLVPPSGGGPLSLKTINPTPRAPSPDLKKKVESFKSKSKVTETKSISEKKASFESAKKTHVPKIYSKDYSNLSTPKAHLVGIAMGTIGLALFGPVGFAVGMGVGTLLTGGGEYATGKYNPTITITEPKLPIEIQSSSSSLSKIEPLKQFKTSVGMHETPPESLKGMDESVSDDLLLQSVPRPSLKIKEELTSDLITQEADIPTPMMKTPERRDVPEVKKKKSESKSGDGLTTTLDVIDTLSRPTGGGGSLLSGIFDFLGSF